MVIYCFDLSMTGTNHVYFNSAMLNILKSAFVNRIVFYSEPNHNELVKSAVGTGKVEYRAIKVYNYSGVRILQSDVDAFFLYWRAIRHIKMNNDDVLFIFNRGPLALLFVNLMNLYYKRPIYNILHGELEYLVNPNMTGLTRYYYKAFKWAYKLSTRHNSYIFLGESIKKVVLANGVDFSNSKLITIDHPYVYNGVSNKNTLLKNEVFVSNIGTAAIRKNSQMMVDLKNILGRTKKSIKLTVIGTVENSLAGAFEKANIHFNASKACKELYEEQIRKVDYSLCFFNRDMNIALASGSFFDCIKFAKPILALRGNPFVDYYFDKLGDIGYRFDSIKEMADFLANLDDKENDHYIAQVKNMEESQRVLSLDNIEKLFVKQVCK